MNSAAAITLPPLRQNLQLRPGSPDEDGAPRWLLFDVVRNRYYTISRTTLDLIQHWRPGTELDAFVANLAQHGIAVEPEEVAALLDFLTANDLIEAHGSEASARIQHRYAAGQPGVWQWLLHNYLFFRIPLFRPDAWLTHWTPRLGWLFSPQAHYLILALGAIGGILVLRDWDRFLATFLHFFNWEGMIWYGLALAAVKSAHELGHAFVAKRRGCRVASIGVAFLVMFPVLYTDATDAWKLRSRRNRLSIVTAGVRTELYIALLATFFWNVLPDGPLKSAAFFLATTSWLASLLVNISPFMRFDGYYAFSDAIGVENLQQRAFALGRWQLRRTLFGLDDPVPEPLPRHRARLLIGYAWGTWIYRFFLFLGIALLVYHFFFKVLGIFLFGVEIAWFVLLPIWHEVTEWRKRRQGFRFSFGRGLVWLLAGMAALSAILPLRSDVQVPAVLQAAAVQSLFAPEAAVIESAPVQDGDRVAAGTILLKLRSPQLERALADVGEELRLARLHLSRAASSAQDKALLGVTASQIDRLAQREAGLRERAARLTVTAPFSGQIRGREQLHAGRWIHPSMPLMTLVAPNSLKITGLADEPSLRSLAVGQTGVFIASRGDGPRLDVRLDGIDIGAVYALPYPELASTHGGQVPVRRVAETRLVPEGARYPVTFSTNDRATNHLQLREPGIVTIAGERRSWLGLQVQRAIAILVREAGF